ncbi:signal peptide peptidase SppA [Nitrincola tapanii]|uniref:Signal peptide peptidase SppA n=1 Tax=Nitrincola tapanii TaxID=1708751 RepID=A0A5A9W4P4_9GAMM|nr:signal peptide peptidase SppA [Nitrincola tapanii]KAA0875464.1 signal peptide peptidase SppA [Nitrincola tapanii]
MSNNHWDDPEQQDKSVAKQDAELEQTLAKAQKDPSSREWRLIEKIVSSLHVEQRRARRWGIFFKLLTFSYLFGLLGMYFIGGGLSPSKKESNERSPHVAVVEVRGVIADTADASADNVIRSLRRAFAAEQSRAVILRINSPGGSPVQAGYINDEIKRLRALHPEKPIYAVITDIGASGGYYIAVAADEIYADKASLVGSIGVTASSFGFVNLIEKLGVERRIMTSGENKAFLDPFSPLREEEKLFWQTVLDTTHQQFIRVVREGRGERLQDDEDLFSGLVWSGEQALELGLVDGLASSSQLAREKHDLEALLDYTFVPSPFDRFFDRLGVTFAEHLATRLSHQLLPELR